MNGSWRYQLSLIGNYLHLIHNETMFLFCFFVFFQFGRFSEIHPSRLLFSNFNRFLKLPGFDSHSRSLSCCSPPLPSRIWQMLCPSFISKSMNLIQRSLFQDVQRKQRPHGFWGSGLFHLDSPFNSLFLAPSWENKQITFAFIKHLFKVCSETSYCGI